jgi:DNA-directed RNA polymerase specialized sigma24 family protein
MERRWRRVSASSSPSITSSSTDALVLVTRSPDEAEEIVQEAFVRIWARWSRVSLMDAPDGYLYRTALNLHHQRGRQAARLARLLTLGASPRRGAPSVSSLIRAWSHSRAVTSSTAMWKFTNPCW